MIGRKLRIPPFSEREAEAAVDKQLSNLTEEQRWKLHNRWVDFYQNQYNQKLTRACGIFEEFTNRLREINDKAHISVLRVSMTTPILIR